MNHQIVSATERERHIDRQILAFRRTGRSILFSSLIEALPDYTWHMLFSTLGRLSKQHSIELVAHQWDYEIIFLEGGARETSMPHLPERSDERDRNEKPYV